VLLYELLTGVTPFDRDTLARVALDEVRRMIRETEPQRPSTRLLGLGEKLTAVAQRRHTQPAVLRRLVMGDLDWIVMKALEKDRKRRFDTANDLLQDVERHLKHEPVEAAAPSFIYRTGKFIRRHRLGVAAGCAVAVAVVLGAVVSLWQAGRASKEAARASQLARNEVKQRQKAEQTSDALLKTTVALSNQTQIAQQAAEDLRLQLYDADMNLALQEIERGYILKSRARLEKYIPQAEQPEQPDLRGFEWYYYWQASESDAIRTVQNGGTVLALNSQGTVGATGFGPGGWGSKIVDLFQLPDLKRIRRLLASNSVISLDFSTDDRFLAIGTDTDNVGFSTGTSNGMVKVWDLGRSNVVAQLRTQPRVYPSHPKETSWP